MRRESQKGTRQGYVEIDDDDDMQDEWMSRSEHIRQRLDENKFWVRLRVECDSNQSYRQLFSSSFFSAHLSEQEDTQDKTSLISSSQDKIVALSLAKRLFVSKQRHPFIQPSTYTRRTDPRLLSHCSLTARWPSSSSQPPPLHLYQHGIILVSRVNEQPRLVPPPRTRAHRSYHFLILLRLLLLSTRLQPFQRLLLRPTPLHRSRHRLLIIFATPTDPRWRRRSVQSVSLGPHPDIHRLQHRRISLFLNVLDLSLLPHPTHQAAQIRYAMVDGLCAVHRELGRVDGRYALYQTFAVGAKVTIYRGVFRKYCADTILLCRIALDFPNADIVDCADCGAVVVSG